MMIKKLVFGLTLLFVFISYAQANTQHINTETVLFINRVMDRPLEIDTTEVLLVDSLELNHVNDLRTVFEKQNAKYSSPKTPSKKLLRLLKKDEPEISTEAMYWARLKRDPSYFTDEYATFKDTIIVDPIFLPIIFKGHRFTDEELTFYSMDSLNPKFKKPDLYTPKPVFEDYMRRKKSEEIAINHIEQTYPFYISYTRRDLPEDIIKPTIIKTDIYDNLSLRIESDADFSDVTPVKFIPERRYWTSGFESAIQFSQNYISPNWHKGGTSNLNIFTKNVLAYNYKRNKITVNNQIEYKTSIYTAPKDTIHAYKVGDDVLWLHNDVGYEAFNKWRYTFSTDIKSQLFQNYKENTHQRQAALFAPITATFGIGMEYKLEKAFKSNRHKKLNLAVNLAPLTYKYMYSRLNDPEKIDLGRHGFELDTLTNKYKKTMSEFGSGITGQIKFSFNRNVSWESRLNYFTSYHNVKLEFENTLIMAISRFFSTRIYVNLRFDDSVEKNEDFDSYFQVNELISFGFNYRW